MYEVGVAPLHATATDWGRLTNDNQEKTNILCKMFIKDIEQWVVLVSLNPLSSSGIYGSRD